ncbi:MAG: ATP-binding protein [Planctomycetota bacterium]|jgi:Fe-S-cluster-containing hydrogenase component 2
MALRNIVKINEEKCNGCGRCVNSCAEGAIQMIDGKAKLVSEIYCDGLGACLDCCPVDAISIEQREAAEFDEEATQQYLEELANNKAAFEKAEPKKSEGFGCPGMKMMKFDSQESDASDNPGDVSSQLRQWPVQLTLVSPMAPYFAGADLMLVADCVPFAMGDVQKLADILTAAKPKSLAVVHMEVPCCGGLGRMAQAAVELSGSALTIKDITVSLRGDLM